MELSARDIHEKQFHDAWRGYSQEEVDDFLDKIADVLDRVQRENDDLRRRMRDLEQSVATAREAEEMLKKTLVTAQQAAEEAVSKAKARAASIIEEAEERARRARDESRERQVSMEADLRRRQSELAREQEQRRRELDSSVEKLRSFETELKQKLRSFFDQQQRALATLNENRAQARPAPRAAAQTAQTAQKEGTFQGGGVEIAGGNESRAAQGLDQPPGVHEATGDRRDSPLPSAHNARHQANESEEVRLEQTPDAEHEPGAVDASDGSEANDDRDYQGAHDRSEDAEEAAALGPRRVLRGIFHRDDE